jgi:hypothetical protein
VISTIGDFKNNFIKYLFRKRANTNTFSLLSANTNDSSGIGALFRANTANTFPLIPMILVI